MADAWLSVIGLYNYDDTIFDDFTVPEGVDRDMAIAKILIDNGELGLVYADPTTFKAMMAVWNAAHENAFARMYAALTAVYNPIHNFDRNETWSDGENTQYSDTDSGNNTRKVAGWNSDSPLTDSERIDSSNTNSGSGAKQSTHTGHLYGNIGVTRTQEMIRDELSLRAEKNFYQVVSDAFRSEFCIMVY